MIHPEAMFHRFTAYSRWYNHSSVLTDTKNASHAAQHISKGCNIHWMGKACSTYGRQEGLYRVLVRRPEEDHLDNLGRDVTIILKWIFKMVGWIEMDWTDVVQDRDRLWALVNVVMSLQVP